MELSVALSTLICLQVSLKNSVVRNLPERQTVGLVLVQLTVVFEANHPKPGCSHLRINGAFPALFSVTSGARASMSVQE